MVTAKPFLGARSSGIAFSNKALLPSSCVRPVMGLWTSRHRASLAWR